MKKRDLIIGIVAVGAAVISLYLAFGGRSQKVNLDTYDVLGAITAEETSKLLGNSGEVLLIAPDSGAYKNPSVEAELSAFEKVVNKQKGMKVKTERIQTTPMSMMATGGGVPTEHFFKALDRHAGVAGIVLFFGFPQLAVEEVQRLKKSGVKTVVVSSFRSGYKQLMEQQVIHLVVMPRLDSSETAKPAARTVRERFDQDFTIVTPADAAALP